MNSGDFPPPRRHGRNVLSLLFIILAVLVVILSILASRQSIGGLFWIYVALAVLAFIPIPLLAYRLYSLARSNYVIDRDQLVIGWGLRLEQIPIAEIEWVRPMSAVANPFPLPLFRLPGALVGTRLHPNLGRIEFLASEIRKLLLIATSTNVYAISPESPGDFMKQIQQAIEMGSPSTGEPRSIYPSFVIAQAWESLLARYLWLAGLFVNIGLLVWVILMSPSLSRISLGFLPSGGVRSPSPGLALILLPIVSIVLFLGGWLTGLMLYRADVRRPMAFIVWISGLVSSALFLIAVLVIVTTPV